jgi:hypothetical protein
VVYQRLTVSAAPATRPERRTRLVYILGAGRSGSTIVGLLLGATSEMAYLGEVDGWFRLRGRPNFKGLEREKFWQNVLEGTTPATRALFGDLTWRRIESTRSLISPRRLWSHRLRRRYRDAVVQVLSLAAQEARTEWLIDSSHYPLRLRELQRASELDITVLYVYRDPRSVVRSFSRGELEQGRKRVLAANAYLWMTTALSMLTYLRTPRSRRTFVRFEEVLAMPQESLGRVRRDLCGLPVTERLPTRVPTGVALQGNRLLAQDVVEFQSRTSEPPNDRLTASMQSMWTYVIRRWLD